MTYEETKKELERFVKLTYRSVQRRDQPVTKGAFWLATFALQRYPEGEFGATVDIMVACGALTILLELERTGSIPDR